MVDYISTFLNALSIQEGDRILFHGNLRRQLFGHRGSLRPVEFFDLFTNVILDRLGSHGILVVPTFTPSFISRGSIFDRDAGPSEMGAYSEYFRKRFHLNRTYHPVYSFCASRPLGSDHFDDHFFAFGVDSVFDWLHREAGKILVLDLEANNSMTVYHHFEKMLGVDYRVEKVFEGYQINQSEGKPRAVKCSVYSRRLDIGVVTDVEGADRLARGKGIYTEYRDDIGSSFRICEIDRLYEHTAELLKCGKDIGYFYKIVV